MVLSSQYRGVIIDFREDSFHSGELKLDCHTKDPTAATHSCAWRSFCRAANRY